MTTHHLLGMGRRTATEAGAALPLAGRTKLASVLVVGAIAGSLTVVVEASATGEAGTFRTIATHTVTALGADEQAITAELYDRVVRARITAVTDATCEVRLRAPWVDVTADAALFSKELRSFADGFARLVAEAEETVMAELMPRAPRAGLTPIVYTPPVVGEGTGDDTAPGILTLDADPSIPGFGDAMRAAIVKQAEHLFRRHKLTQRDDPAALVTLRSLPEKAPNLTTGLARFRPTTLVVWRGR